ncbi:kinesin-like protein KIN-12B [Tanacetum coccineum]|uniref:Kinesin-like protein KIN-12B n=1 Tax=Tanacetum coccineum TaxID=301880 RepID=A0ABQ5J760_9ASTR
MLSTVTQRKNELAYRDWSDTMVLVIPASDMDMRAVEKVLAGAIRREMSVEEFCTKQHTEILQLISTWVKQYQLKRVQLDYRGILQEDKIARLENLMEGVLSAEDFANSQLISLPDKNKPSNGSFCRNEPRHFEDQPMRSRTHDVSVLLKQSENYLTITNGELSYSRLTVADPTSSWYIILFGGRIRDEMLRLQGLGSNTPSGVPYTDDEINVIIRGGKQRGTFPVLFEYGGGSGNGRCGDDELGDGKDGGEDEEDADS